MNKVITINLGGRAYQLEESGYDALRAYLDDASAKLAEDPGKSEIIADLEQAIGEKCERTLNPHKTVVTSDEIQRIIDEMGPVEGESKTESESESSTQTGRIPRRFFLSRDGAVFAGVCAGLAQYFEMDVTLVRILFILLTVLTGGIWIVLYVALALLVPYADTAEAQAQARGEPFNAESLIQRAKERWGESYERVTGEKWDHFAGDIKNAHEEHKKWHEASKQMRSDIKQQHKQWKQEWKRSWKAQRYQYRHPNPGLGWLMGVLGLLWLLAEISLISSGAIFGWAIPASVPLWAAVILLFIAYQALIGPLRASKYQYYYGNEYYSGYDAWEGFVGVLTFFFIVIAIVWAYLHIPQFYFFLHHPVLGSHQLGPAIKSWFGQ